MHPGAPAYSILIHVRAEYETGRLRAAAQVPAEHLRADGTLTDAALVALFERLFQLQPPSTLLSYDYPLIYLRDGLPYKEESYRLSDAAESAKYAQRRVVTLKNGQVMELCEWPTDTLPTFTL